MSTKSRSKLEQALAEEDDIEAAERSADPDAPLPKHVKVSRPGRARSKVLQVRLNDAEMEALEAIAEGRGLPVSTVARERLLELIEDAASHAGAAGRLGRLLATAERLKVYADEVRDELPASFPSMLGLSSTRPKRKDE
ncbi:MAG TPA: DUF6290 family protein [Mycobacterium sp.]|jgi:hypothetical protein|nr:DUF6290 family protein [Mycobacterium sp.]